MMSVGGVDFDGFGGSGEAFSHGFVDEFPRNILFLFPLTWERWKDEDIFSVAKLFIETQCAVHAFKKTFRRGKGGRQMSDGKEVLETAEDVGSTAAESDGEARCGQHADGDGFAVGELIISAEF